MLQAMQFDCLCYHYYQFWDTSCLYYQYDQFRLNVYIMSVIICSSLILFWYCHFEASLTTSMTTFNE